MFKKQIIFLIQVVTVVFFLTGCNADIEDKTRVEENKEIEIEGSAADDAIKISSDEFDAIFYNNVANGDYIFTIGEKIYYYGNGYCLAFHDEEVYISSWQNLRRGKLSDLISADSIDSFYSYNTDVVTEAEDIISEMENQ